MIESQLRIRFIRTERPTTLDDLSHHSDIACLNATFSFSLDVGVEGARLITDLGGQHKHLVNGHPIYKLLLSPSAYVCTSVFLQSLSRSSECKSSTFETLNLGWNEPELDRGVKSMRVR